MRTGHHDFLQSAARDRGDNGRWDHDHEAAVKGAVSPNVPKLYNQHPDKCLIPSCRSGQG